MEEPRRFKELDGLRGAAAFSVLAGHICAAFWPALIYGREHQPASWFSSFATSPFFVFVDGPFWVYVFFVLSGFVIAASGDKTTIPLINLCAARIVRLMLPCAAAVLLAGALAPAVQAGLDAATPLLDHHWWIQKKADARPSYFDFAREALGYYVIRGHSKADPVLWTMKLEVIGSLAIYTVFVLVHSVRLRVAALVSITALAVTRHVDFYCYLAFLGGSFIYLFRARMARLPYAAGWFALVVGLLLGSRPYFVDADTLSSAAVPIFAAFPIPALSLCWPVGAVLILIGVLTVDPVARILRSGVIQFAGRISFALYLTHFPLLFAVLANLFAVTHGHPVALAISVVFYIVVSVAVATVFATYVDERSINLAQIVRRKRFVTTSASDVGDDDLKITNG